MHLTASKCIWGREFRPNQGYEGRRSRSQGFEQWSQRSNRNSSHLLHLFVGHMPQTSSLKSAIHLVGWRAVALPWTVTLRLSDGLSWSEFMPLTRRTCQEDIGQCKAVCLRTIFAASRIDRELKFLNELSELGVDLYRFAARRVLQSQGVACPLPPIKTCADLNICILKEFM